MGKVNIVEICERVLSRLVDVGNEDSKTDLDEKLIFPCKRDKQIRISEQELRLLFIEEFLDNCPEFYYSIETPTKNKYKFGKVFLDIELNEDSGQSALLDMCIHQREDGKYQRLMNIEFKYGNVPIEKVAKDILKLIEEPGDGTFVWLLKNTDSGTLFNINKKSGVLDKLYKSFKEYWKTQDKTISVIIISLEQKAMISHQFKVGDLQYLFDDIDANKECSSIKDLCGEWWKLKKKRPIV